MIWGILQKYRYILYKTIQFNPGHRVALFCNSQNEKFHLLEFLQMDFNIYIYHSEKNELLQNQFTVHTVHNTQNVVIIKQHYRLKWF